MAKQLFKPNVKLGDHVLRRKGNGGDFDTWVVCLVNETYLDLINEFPDDYRQMNGDKLEILNGNLKWKPRYSKTDEPDALGRWARQLFFKNLHIAWVNRIELDDGRISFSGHLYFPPENGNRHLNTCSSTFEGVRDIIETEWKKFIKIICGKEKKPIQLAPCRIKIVKCSYAEGWYKDLIGEEFDVDNPAGTKDYVLWEDYVRDREMWRHIKQSDCEIVHNATE